MKEPREYNRTKVSHAKELALEVFPDMNYVYWKDACSVLDVNPETIISKDRHEHIRTIRHIMATLLIAQGHTTTTAGKKLNRNHSTIMHSVRTIHDFITWKDEKVTNIVNALLDYDFVIKPTFGSNVDKEVEMLIILENKLNKVVY